MKNIHGAKKGGGKQRQPVIAPDSAQSKAYINMLYGLGEGEIAGLVNGYKSVYLDDTPLQKDNGEFNFPNVKVDFRTGTNDQEYIDGFPDVASETAVNIELKHGTPWVKSFNNLDLDAVRVRLKWGALRSQNTENGDVNGVKIDYAIDVKTDNGGWVEMLSTAINAKTSDAYERSHRIDLPTATQGWQVRVRRLTPNSTSDFVSDKMYISAITEVIDLKLRYPNTALLGLRYDAESFSNVAKMSARCKGLIIKVPTNYDPVSRTYDGLWNGEFKLAYCNNPAWVYYDLCTATRYGLGRRLKEYMIDKWSLYRLAQYCDQMVDDGMGGTEPRFTVNIYIQSAEGAFEILSKLAGVFRAISYWDGTSIVLDADIPQDSMYSFSRANVIDGMFEYTGTRARDRHTVAKVAWDNPANHFKTEYEFVRDEKAIAKFGVRVADISAWGCTSKGQAQRAGLWALKSEQLETRMVTFKVGLDGYIPAPAKVIEISDELFAGRATGGRVLAINDKKTVITLDRTITAKANDTLVINGDDGQSQRRQIESMSGDKITVTKAFGDISVENVWVLDSTDLATMKFRVLSVTADENHQFTITAVQYNHAKYDAIDTGAYINERPISVINPTVQAPAKAVNLSSYHTVNQGVSITTLIISWEQVAGAVKYTVEWRKDNGNWQVLPPTGTNSIEIAGVYAGQYEARVTAISAFGQSSLATHSALTQIQGKVGKPNRPAFIRATGVLFGMNLAWGFANGSDDTNFTEIQVSPDGRSNIATLGTFAYPTNKHEINGLQGNLTQFYRARIVDKLGNTSDWTNWISGTTSADAAKVLDLISGQISESHLDQTLRTPIGKIGTIESTVNGIGGKISNLESGVAGLNTNLGGLNGQLTTVKNDLTAAKKTLQTAATNITTERNRISTAIRDIATLQNANNAKTQEIANLVQTMGNHTSSIRELGVTTGELSQKYSQLKTVADKATSDITAIRQTQAGQATSIEQMNSKFGWQTLTTATDLNTLTAQGNYFIAGARTNSPVNAWVYLIVDVPRSDRITQTAWADNASNTTYRRTRSNTTWTAWEKMATGAELSTKASSADMQTLRQTVADSDSALSRRIDSIDAAYKQADTQANAKIESEITARTSADSALGQRIDTLQADYNGNKASVANQLKTLSDKDTATASQISSLTANVSTAQQTAKTANSKADTATTKADNAQSTANNALNRANTANSAITAEQKARADADGVLGQRISAIDTAYKQADTATNAKLANAEKAISDSNTALSQRISALDSAYKKSDTNITARLAREETARTSGDNANAQALRTLESTVQGVNGRVGTSESKIASLERTASDTNQALATAQDQLNARFDGLSVGGRNLLRHTQHLNQHWRFASGEKGNNMSIADGVARLTGIGSTWKHMGYDINKATAEAWLQEGTAFTLSVYAKKISGNPRLSVALRKGVTGGFKDDLVGRSFDLTNDWQKLVVSGTITAGDLQYLFARFEFWGDGVIELKKPKLEYGTVATDWTPAPEDLQADIDNKATTANLDILRRTLTNTDTALSQQITAMDTTYKSADRTLMANLASETTARTSADSALGQRIDTLQADYNGNKANIASQLKTLSDKEQALAASQNQLTAKFDNLKIGGRNLLVDSEFRQGKWLFAGHNNQVTHRINNGVLTLGGNIAFWKHAKLTSGVSELNDVLQVGETYTLSVWARSTQGQKYVFISIRNWKDGQFSENIAKREQVGETWQRISVTGVYRQTPHNGQYLDVLLEHGEIGEVEFKQPKLEVGNVATDWTPAPEDVNVDLTPYATNASLNEFKQAQATKDTATAHKLSQLESNLGQKANATALNELNTRVTQADGKITTEAQKVATLQTTVNSQTASIRNVEQSVNGVKAVKAVTVDNNGFISGYGLMSELQNGRVTSRFGVNADQIYFGATTTAKKPFVFTTRTTTIDGVSYPAGAWLNSASIANASIKLAHIDKASIGNLSALSANIGHFKSSQTGARLEIKDSVLLVYDANNTLRVRLGLW
ncbi:MAG: TipJ family phage tail tip protein [Moraxella sp.]